MLIHRPPLKSDFKGVIEVTLLDLKPQNRLYEFLVQIKVMEFSFDCLFYFYRLGNLIVDGEIKDFTIKFMELAFK